MSRPFQYRMTAERFEELLSAEKAGMVIKRICESELERQHFMKMKKKRLEREAGVTDPAEALRRTASLILERAENLHTEAPKIFNHPRVEPPAEGQKIEKEPEKNPLEGKSLKEAVIILRDLTLAQVAKGVVRGDVWAIKEALGCLRVMDDAFKHNSGKATFTPEDFKRMRKSI